MSILNRVKKALISLRPKNLFEAGEVIRVIEGHLRILMVLSKEVNYRKNKLKISVSFWPSTSVEWVLGRLKKS